VVSLSDLMDAARGWANEIIQCSPLAVKASKQMIQEGLKHSLEDAFDKSYVFAQAVLESEDLQEGIRAFAKNRKPKWKGR